MFGFTRGAAVKKRSINNASQNLKPAGLVWEVGKNLRMLGTRGAATLSNTSFSRNPRSAGNSHKLGKINKTDHLKIFKKGLRENISHLLHYHAPFQQAKALNGINSYQHSILLSTRTEANTTGGHMHSCLWSSSPSAGEIETCFSLACLYLSI